MGDDTTMGTGLLTMAQAAARLGVSPLSARRALTNAGLVITAGPRAHLIREADLTNFVAEREALAYKGRGRPRKQPAGVASSGAGCESPRVNTGCSKGIDEPSHSVGFVIACSQEVATRQTEQVTIPQIGGGQSEGAAVSQAAPLTRPDGTGPKAIRQLQAAARQRRQQATSQHENVSIPAIAPD